MDPLEAVRLYVGLAANAPDVHDRELAEGLMTLGLSRDQAERGVAFIPIAFGRQLLSSSDATFSDAYEIHDSDTGRRTRGAFGTEPLFQAAVRYAAEHSEDEAVTLIGERSAEVRAARKLLREGASIAESNAVFTEPVFMRIPIPETRAP